MEVLLPFPGTILQLLNTLSGKPAFPAMACRRRLPGAGVSTLAHRQYLLGAGTLTTFGKDGIVIWKTRLPQRFFPNCLCSSATLGCFRTTVELNGGKPKCCRNLVIFVLQMLKAPKNTKHEYLGLAPLYIGYTQIHGDWSIKINCFAFHLGH